MRLREWCGVGALMVLGGLGARPVVFVEVDGHWVTFSGWFWVLVNVGVVGLAGLVGRWLERSGRESGEGT